MPGVLQNLVYIGNAKVGVTDVYEGPESNPIAADAAVLNGRLHAAWKYLGVAAPGSFKNNNAKSVYDIKTGLPKTVKASFVTEIEGKVSFTLMEWTGAAIKAAVGGAEPLRLYPAAPVGTTVTGGLVSAVKFSSAAERDKFL